MGLGVTETEGDGDHNVKIASLARVRKAQMQF